MKVILIGYRATGKSTVGRLLSRRLEIPFIDTDCLIEESAGMNIKKLIGSQGWPAFRQKEKEAVSSVAEKKLCVVATGGGAVLDEGNRKILKSMGVVVCLKAPLQDIIERLRSDDEQGASRPQFTSGDIAAETVAVLGERMPLYEAVADNIIDTRGKNVVQVAEEIYQLLVEKGVVFEIGKLKRKNRNNQ
ncbi:MAG TPA: shikimate kinase [Smithellaceae bacterium]|jgi:shikimate kinase|nr:shikimate kinase [Smithellaceae bacterium]HQM45883.1 shikimate kinase [Smithellaceae bacterium]